MEFSTIFGLLLGLGLISLGIFHNAGDLSGFKAFLNIDAVLIVVGGTTAATLVNYPVKNFIGIFKVLGQAFKKPEIEPHEVIEVLIAKAEKSRKKGILSLEEDLETISHKYLRDGLELAIDERDPSRLRNYLDLGLANIQRRHSIYHEIFLFMGAYAPAFGLLGTVLGLIIMMTNFSGAGNGSQINTIEFDVAKQFSDLLGGMGLALITTFYGVLLSNLVFLPLGGKLKRKSEEELMVLDIMVEGIIGIHANDHPLILHDKLMTFVSQSRKKEKK